MLKYSILFSLFFVFSLSSFSQKTEWFYLRAKDTTILPQFNRINNQLVYAGTDEKLKSVLENFVVFEFKKTFRNAKKEDLKKTFFVVSDKKELLNDLLKNASHLFEFGELITEEEKKIFEPNDYGLTATIGGNKGLQVNLDYLDYLGLPKAWYYTTGNKETIIGLSDGQVDITNTDFRGKTKVLTKSSFSKGHGTAVASILAAQGNNNYGVPGVCFDCSLTTTKYGDFKTLKYLTELSKENLKVINCSWAGTNFQESAQTVIDQLFKKGIIVVAGSGNANWNITKGQRLYYPASFNHVISVAAGMYKHEKVSDNILISDKGYPYAENIRGHVGRTMGFQDHNAKNSYHIYPVAITTLNTDVDILAPSTGVLLFNKFILENEIVYDTKEHTSNTTPFVTGTIALMQSLNPCLPINEVESILKITATNIDHIQANKPYAGMYGAGMLHTGKAVELVYKLYTPTETSYIENQIFTRWDFKLTSLSNQTIIRNQKFIDNSTLNLIAKNRIVIGGNTILKPNANGKISLKIDPTLTKQCDLIFREGFPNNKYYYPMKKNSNASSSLTPK